MSRIHQMIKSIRMAQERKFSLDTKGIRASFGFKWNEVVTPKMWKIRDAEIASYFSNIRKVGKSYREFDGGN